MDDENIPNFSFGFNFEDLESLPNLQEKNENAQTLLQRSRFPNLSVENVQNMKAEGNNNNTIKSTNTWVKVYEAWADAKQARKDIENLNPKELNQIFEKFYAEVKKRDGSDYEPESLAVMQAALDRHLRDKNYGISIIRNGNFHSSNMVLKGKATTLRKTGMGNRPNASKPLTWDDEEKLWQLKKLGSEGPEVLLHTVWFVLTQHLGFRGCQEHQFAEVQDFKFQVDENGIEFVMFDDSKPTKTRVGGLRKKKRVQNPQMFATGGDRCPVAIFKKFLSHRPQEMLNNGPLYLSVIKNPKSSVWYKSQRMGINRIGEIMKKIVEGTDLGVNKKLTNHSGRKTLVKKLDEADVTRAKIVAVTGHRNEKSLDDYVDSMNNKQAKQLSNIISGSSTQRERETSLQLASPQVPSISNAKILNNNLTTHSNYVAVPQHPYGNCTFPVINLANLAQNMSNSTINLSFSTTCAHQQNSEPSQKLQRRRRYHFLESDSEDED